LPAPAQLPSRAWLTVGLLWGAACLNYVDRLMITTMRGSIKEAIPMTEAQFRAADLGVPRGLRGLQPVRRFSG